MFPGFMVNEKPEILDTHLFLEETWKETWTPIYLWLFSWHFPWVIT